MPEEWLGDVRDATEDSVLDLADHLPAEAAEAAEALLELAVGGNPQPSFPAAAGGDPFSHPDALRRFRILNNVDELAAALEYPWEKWTVILHPDQRGIVERNYNGPARVSGPAGTGKIVVALHRAAHLARNNAGAHVLHTTFSDTLANQLRAKLAVLMSDESGAAGKVDVQSLDAVGLSLYEARFGMAELATWETVEGLVQKAASAEGTKFALTFVTSDWERVIDAWQLSTWQDYRDVRRIGRYRRLSEAQRETLWPVFERVRAGLRERKLITNADMFGRLTTELPGQEFSPYQYIVVDEAQDVSVPQLRFLVAFAGGRQNGLFFAGDLGQRIFQQPFSWRELGVDVRGRSQTLRINYRTTHQIRAQADRLLDPELAYVDGNTEERKGTVSVFNGPTPTVQVLDDEQAETEMVTEWLEARIKDGLEPDEIAVFVRSSEQIDRTVAARESGRNAVRCPGRQHGNDQRCRYRRHNASGQRPRVPRRSGDHLRQRGHPSAVQSRSPSSTRRAWRRCTTLRGTCSTSPAPVSGTTCS